MRERTIRTLAVLTLAAAPALAQPDLQVQAMSFAQGPQIGTCNTLRIVARNAGDEAGNQITKALVKVFPAANAFTLVFQKAVFFSAVQAGASQHRDIAGVELPGGGPYTVQVVLDVDGQLAESDEGNNSSHISVTPRGSCGGGECDLTARFTWPNYDTLPASYPARFSIHFANAGGATCPARTVQLERHSGSRVTGPGSQVASAALAALEPNQERSLSLTDSSHAASGEFTYAVTYQGGHSDADDSNHSPAKTVTFEAAER
ncbi:MAG TPA: CARDB domain-containing protein [Thermoanaerobaculia bacterium]|nr:CARDB domain-containing protein [Thermoanaerobaculia bacterium]